MALAFDLLLLGVQRLADPVAAGDDGMSHAFLSHPVLASFGGAIEFIFNQQTSNVTGGKKVGGIDQVLELALNQIEVTGLRAGALAAGRPADRPLPRPPGHRRTARGRRSATPAARSPSWR